MYEPYAVLLSVVNYFLLSKLGKLPVFTQMFLKQRNKLNSLSRLESWSNSGWKGPLEAIYVSYYALVSVLLANMKLGTHFKKCPAH